jgi:hypothetical protein
MFFVSRTPNRSFGPPMEMLSFFQQTMEWIGLPQIPDILLLGLAPLRPMERGFTPQLDQSINPDMELRDLPTMGRVGRELQTVSKIIQPSMPLQLAVRTSLRVVEGYFSQPIAV